MKFAPPDFWPLPGDLVLGRTGPFGLFPPLRLRSDERTTHMYVLGITGQGKSKLLENCLLQDILSGRGCGLIDPHSDLVADLLTSLYDRGFFKSERNRQRVVYLDPSRAEFQIPFNVLATPYPPYQTAIHILEAFKRTWPESLREAPRFSNILLASLLALIPNRLTLSDLPRFLTHKEFREEQLEEIQDPEIVALFHDRLDKWGREEPLMLESVLNKVSAFTLNPSLRSILGAKENYLDFRGIMDNGQVLLVDLGRCDGETRRLLGSLIVTGMEQAALSRKDEPAKRRRSFYFYIDEFQDFCANDSSVTSLSQILSESRKFGLHLTLAHQTLGQMSSDKLRAALGNVGTKVVFAVDRGDAESMARKLFMVDGEQVKHEVESERDQEKTHPIFYPLPEAWERAVQSIQNLKPRTCWVKSPHNAVRKMQTVTLSNSTLEARELERIKLCLVRRTTTSSMLGLCRRATSSAVTFYETLESSPSRQKITD